MVAWIMRNSLLKPLQALSVVAKRLGANQLDGAEQVQGPEETRVLSQAFEDMRLNLRSARVELVQWNTELEQRVVQCRQELEKLNQVSREISSRQSSDGSVARWRSRHRRVLHGKPHAESIRI